MKSGDGFGICLISSGSEVGAVAKPFAYGTLVEIIDWDQEDSGLLVIVTKGLRKFRIVDSKANSEGLLVGEVELLPYEEKTAIPAEYGSLVDLLQRVLEHVRPLIAHAESDFTDATWVSSRLVELLPMSVAERHDLVAMSDPLERLLALQDVIDSKA